jgi:MFS family permease
LDPANRNSVKSSEGRFQKLFKYLRTPLVGSLIFVFFLSSVAMSTMEATLVLLVGDRFAWGVKEVSFGFAYIGFIMILSQGFLVRRLLPIVGEKKLMITGLMCMAVGLSLISFSFQIWVLAISQTILAVGFAFTSPSILGSVSLLTSVREQGEALGTTQGTASLGRIVGPALGGWLYQHVSRGSPFLAGGAFALIAFCVVLLVFAKLPEAAKATAT